MPPHAVWFRGVDAVAAFLRTPRFQAFWSAGLEVAATRANRLPAQGFYSGLHGGRLHALGVTRFLGRRVAEMTVFIGPRFLEGFDLPGTTARFSAPPLS